MINFLVHEYTFHSTFPPNTILEKTWPKIYLSRVSGFGRFQKVASGQKLSESEKESALTQKPFKFT
jgi:hypothetical protein